jgi:hypothetical protein
MPSTAPFPWKQPYRKLATPIIVVVFLGFFVDVVAVAVATAKRQKQSACIKKFKSFASISRTTNIITAVESARLSDG